MTIGAYAEIGITTNFSFLRGGSDPRAYVHQASELGIPVIGIADHNTLAGIVRLTRNSIIPASNTSRSFWSDRGSFSWTVRRTF